MTTVDPSTGAPLPPDAIQRVLFVASEVHVYQIPPLTSTKGYTASTWTADNNKRQIFTARLRILETALPTSDGRETVKTDIVLEDRSTGELFAAAPYIAASVVEQVLDSSRFFAVRVQGEGGRKAVLGIGFEERSEAFDFGVSLQEVRKIQGLDGVVAPPGAPTGGKKGSQQQKTPEVLERKDFSLKEGETITINIGGKGRRQDKGSTSIAPPSAISPSSGAQNLPFLPPPPSTAELKAERRRSRAEMPVEPGSAADLGFDDGEFGEFQ